jgi:hypothetical protein
MKAALAILAFTLALASPALAQQNQAPGFLGSEGEGGGSARPAQAGANTTDGTTTGVSGPKSDDGGPPGNLTLPDLPSESLCKDMSDDVRTNCLSTVLNRAPATGAPQ